MYKVMARRYRPALFKDVVGQEHIAATLQAAIQGDRVAHAYIFTGGHGCGKTTMARILAKALVCENGPAAEPCCQCSTCQAVAEGRCPDVIEIDGASNNSVDDIRTLCEQAMYVPNAKYKIYIVDEVHMLTGAAFNSFLKTLEEPPDYVKFIFATTDPHKVLPTILSRCQRFDFRLVPMPKLVDLFRRLAADEDVHITEDAIEAVAASAAGSVRDGLSILDQLFSSSGGREITRQYVESVRGAASSENIAELFAAIAAGNCPAALATTTRILSFGTNVGDFLDQLIAWGRDLMYVLASGTQDGISVYGPARTTLTQLAKSVTLEQSLLWLDVLTQARTRVRARALTNPSVALEIAIVRLAGLGGLVPVSALLDKIGQTLAVLPPVPALPAQTMPPAVPTASTPAAPTGPEPKAAPPVPAPLPPSAQAPVPAQTPPSPVPQAVPVLPPKADLTARRKEYQNRRQQADEARRNMQADPGVAALCTLFGATVTGFVLNEKQSEETADAFTPDTNTDNDTDQREEEE